MPALSRFTAAISMSVRGRTECICRRQIASCVQRCINKFCIRKPLARKGVKAPPKSVLLYGWLSHEGIGIFSNRGLLKLAGNIGKWSRPSSLRRRSLSAFPRLHPFKQLLLRAVDPRRRIVTDFHVAERPRKIRVDLHIEHVGDTLLEFSDKFYHGCFHHLSWIQVMIVDFAVSPKRQQMKQPNGDGYPIFLAGPIYRISTVVSCRV